jgi:catecholate siderophore receptor
VNTSTDITRQLQSRDMVDTIVANQTSATSRFGTGPAGHAVSAGLELSHETSRNFARTGPVAPTADLFNPNPADAYPGPIIRTGASTNGVANSIAGYAFDTVSFGQHLELTGGLRWERFAADTESIATTGVLTPLGRVDHILSWRAGAVFKPRDNGSLYLGYGTSANPSAEGLALSASTVTLDPEHSRNYEIGTKWDVMGSRLSANAAVFRTEKTNARTPGVNPGDPPTVLAGEQLVSGIEVGLSGRVTRQWSIFSGYAFMDSSIEASNVVDELDAALALTPRHTLSLWTTYDLPWNVSVGGGTQYMDAVFRNATNTARVPSYWLSSALVSYKVNDHFTLRMNGQNLADTTYVDRVGGGHYIPGPGRQMMLSTDVRF